MDPLSACQFIDGCGRRHGHWRNSVLSPLRLHPRASEVLPDRLRHVAGNLGDAEESMKVFFKDPELRSIEERLKRTQTTLTLELCAVFKYVVDINVQERQTAAEAPQTAVKFSHNDVLGFSKGMSRLSVAARDVAHQQEILKGLAFESFRYRRHVIVEAHEETYPRALRGKGRQTGSQDRIERWFTAGTHSDIFGVSGKPGSDKWATYLGRSSRALLEYLSDRVEFMHCTVADFLDTGEMVQVLAEQIRAGLDPLLSILDCITSLRETQRNDGNVFLKNLNMAMSDVASVGMRKDGLSTVAHCLLRQHIHTHH
ncbi:uncharacterized protein PG986_002439 [Apiospora aurea]|uniref:Uncharacterized protein n=1 Tax=Apiospora aurea TaxID=335848 RepID=A0ABR1QNU3_9PEZI